MLHIAICDDEQKQLVMTEALLNEYHGLHPELDLRVDTFPSGAALLERLRTNGSFDIYLLDILIPDGNGIELGLKIRKADQCGHIFYLTTSPDYAIDSYLTKASQYLLKPVKKELLFRALDEAVQNWLQEHQSFVTIKTRDGLRRVALRTVVYGELVGHSVRYYLSDGTTLEGMSVRTSFHEAVAVFLAHERFALCATSFFVNLAYVDMIESNGARLMGGGIVPLSRALRTEVTNRWMDYHLKGGAKA